MPSAPAVVTPERGFWFRVVIAVLARPHLWWTALRQLVAVARRGWWRSPPFTPVPDAGYLRFRFETAYGADGVARAGDVVRYLEWCRRRPR